METLAKENTNQIQNDFKAFAVGPEANVIDQTEYEQSGFLKEGFKKGMARSSEINKAIRQGSSIAAAVAKFTAEKTGEDILDNGDIDALSRHIETAISSVSSLLIAEAEGTSDVLTANFVPIVKELKNGLLVHVRAMTKNMSVNPTFSADQTGAKAIVKGNNLALDAGDIAGAGHWLEMQYDSQLDKWILQNPAKGISPLSGVPVGTVEYFAMATPPAGYLKADGVAVGRKTYAGLFATIGTTFGEGDGETTFNLPDLINRFAQGSHTPGQKVDAGLPNIEGTLGTINNVNSGAIYWNGQLGAATNGSTGTEPLGKGTFDASRFSPIYGASNTVQPAALTLLPCIKAFDAATNPGLIDITELANEVANLALKLYKHGSSVFTENGTFAVPESVTFIKVIVQAGGGGGSGGWFWGSSSYPGYGGGGGGALELTLHVEPGQEFPVVVGAGGTRGVAANYNGWHPSQNATDGGDSSFGVHVAYGGVGSKNNAVGNSGSGLVGISRSDFGLVHEGESGSGTKYGKSYSGTVGGNGGQGGGNGGHGVSGIAGFVFIQW